MYTKKKDVDKVLPSYGTSIVWEGDTHDVIKGFPENARANLGHDLRLLQNGLKPKDSSPVPGLDDVFELRDQDPDFWFRVLFLKKIKNRIHVLNCFKKKSNQITKQDIATARARLKVVHLRLVEEERNAKRKPQAAHNPR